MGKEPDCNRQQGGTMVFALVVLAATLFMVGNILLTTRKDVQNTRHTLQHTRAEFVAQSALNWALINLKNKRFATHDSTGTSLANVSGQWGDADKRIPPGQLNDTILKLYAGETVGYDGDGRVTQTTGDPDKTLSGVAGERASFRVWFPYEDTIFVEASAEVGDKQSDAFLALYYSPQVAAGPGNAMSYGFVSDGPFIPIYRKTPRVQGKIHSNADLYIYSPKDFTLYSDTVSAVGSIIRDPGPYEAMNTAKENFIFSNQLPSPAWITNGLFPNNISTITVGGGAVTCNASQDFHNLNNGVELAMPCSPDAGSWPAGIKSATREGAAAIAIPSFDPALATATTSQGPADCDGDVKAIMWDDLARLPDDEFIYNHQYGAGRDKGTSYIGYYADDGLGGNSSGNLPEVQSGNIVWGQFTEMGDWRTAIKAWYGTGPDYDIGPMRKIVQAFGGSLDGERWYGHTYSGRWVKCKWYDLADADSYPRKCSTEGGIVDFGNHNVIVCNGDSLLYPITIYTTGEIYLIGDFNVGHYAQQHGAWDADTSQIGPRISSGAIKGAAVVAMGNRIWYLRYSALEADYGFGIGGGTPRNTTAGNRDGKRLRDFTATDGGVSPSTHSDWNGQVSRTRITRLPHSGSWKTSPPWDTRHLTGVYVGVFADGVPMIDQGYWLFSRSRGVPQTQAPTTPEWWDARNEELIIYGTEFHYTNAPVEGDWNGSGYDAVGAGSGYWHDLNNSADNVFTDPDGATGGNHDYNRHDQWSSGSEPGAGFPARPGWLPPRNMRGYNSFPLTRIFTMIPDPPLPPGSLGGSPLTIARKYVYKR